MAFTMQANWVERVTETQLIRRDYYDNKPSNLGLRVSRTGSKVWFVKYRLDDRKNRRLTLGPYPAISLGEAREAAKEILLRVARGEDPAGKKQAVKASPSVRDLAEAYIERYAKVQKRSWRKDEQELAATVLPAWGHRKACEIQRRDVLALLEAKVRRGSPIQANRLLALIRKMYNWGIAQDLVPTTPCLMVKAPSPESPRDKVLNTQELRALWAAFEQHGGAVGAMFKLRLLTAQRGGEVATMRWEDLDLESGWWTIPAQFSKNKLSHRVPLSTPVLRMLQGLMAARDGKDGGWVFRGKRIGQHYKHIGQPTKVLRELSGVEFVPHDLRRAAASHMAGSGLNVPRLVISKILNHKEAGITHIYERHSYDDEKRDALERWAKRLEEIVGEGQPDRPVPLAPARPAARRAPSSRRTQRVR